MRKSFLLISAVVLLFTSCNKDETNEIEETTIVYSIELDVMPPPEAREKIKVSYRDQNNNMKDTIFYGRNGSFNSIVVENFKYEQEAALEINNEFHNNGGFIITASIINIKKSATPIKEVTSGDLNFSLSALISK